MTSDELIGASTKRGTGRTRRRDAVRNRQKLLTAASEVLGTAPDTLNMSDVAERAGLSVATAYRYFPSLEDLLTTYVRGVIVELRDYSHDCPKTGTALFEDVVAHWVQLLHLHGAAIVQLRSHTGFLTRLLDNDERIGIVRDAWERPIRGVLRQLGIADEHFNHALFLYNVLFDPREILDLVDTGLQESEAVDRLIGAFYGALQGWAQQDTRPTAGNVARSRNQPEQRSEA
jgi:AcrR family transcriptional regulator